MKCTSRSPCETGPVEKDARTVDDACVKDVFTQNSALGLLVVLEVLGIEGGCESGDTHGFVLVEQLDTYRAAAESTFWCGDILDAIAARVPNAGPVRFEKVRIDTPLDIIVVRNGEPTGFAIRHPWIFADRVRSPSWRSRAPVCDARRLRVFLTHNPEDLDAYYGRALTELMATAEVVINPLDRDLSTPELIEESAGCQVIAAHRATPGEAELFEQRPELLAFLRCAVDISTIDVDAASTNGVLVGHADKSFIASTAELALGLYLDTARHIAESTHDYRSGNEPPQRPGHQIRGKVAGIIGFGSVGGYLADLLQSIGLTVLVHDPFVDVPEEFEQLALDPLLERSDVVFPLAPGVPATENFIGEHELAMMKHGATLINVSRGEVLDEDAVAAALDSGQLGALGMDVGRAADQRPSVSLASRPGVVATPHLGGLTPENADEQAMSSVEQIRAILAGEMPQRVVNAAHATRLDTYWANR